ncbi:MAG: DnaJ domain-containing protein [Synergistaceae bacterium]|nr:DnaJ domain-containing protein [Synergistaceae bacterium]
MENTEILSNLKILGLEAGATIDDIHSAFRKLAHELHPDVSGSNSDHKFKQVTSAYTALKNIKPEDLIELEIFMKKIPLDKPKLKRDIYDYYSAEKKRRADDKVIDSILDKYEEELKSFNSSKISEGDLDMEAVTLRLKSENPKVAGIALKNAGAIANRVEFRIALVDFLKRSEIDDELAGIIGSLPFDDTTRKLIAIDASNYAQKFPTGLIIALIGTDADVMENFLLHVRPDDVAVVLRRWPTGKAMNTSVIRKLLESNDPRVLVPLLGAMKTHFPSSANDHVKRLWELERHSAAAVRAWAKKLT